MDHSSRCTMPPVTAGSPRHATIRPRPAPTLLRRFGKSGGVQLACSTSEAASITGTRCSSMVRVAASCNCLTLRFKAFSEHDRRSHRQGPFPAPGRFLDMMCTGTGTKLRSSQ